MQPKEIAKEILLQLGGKDNIRSVTHCATRLRVVLHDEGKANKAIIENLVGVEGVFARSGQIQIIIGMGIVNKVYRSLVEISGITSTNACEQSKDIKTQMHPIIKMTEILSNIFVPIIPVLVASGLLLGFLSMMKAFDWVAMDSAWMKMLDMFSSTAFNILPILVGFSAAKEFGSTPYLGAIIGGILTHPVLLNPWEVANTPPEYMDVLGFKFALIGYQGTVIPILLSVFFMSKIEKGLRKVVPHSLDLFVIPFVTIMLTGLISLLAIGPLGIFIGSLITDSLEFVRTQAGFIEGFLFGGLYSFIVITGLHHSFYAIELGLLSDPEVGVNYLLPIWSMANVAQGGAALAVFFKTKNKKLKGIAIPAALSAFLGVIEPVIFGINLKLVKPFIGAVIGGALGGAYVVLNHVGANSYGLTGIPMISIVSPLGLSNVVNYLIGFAIAVISAFTATWILGFKEEE